MNWGPRSLDLSWTLSGILVRKGSKFLCSQNIHFRLRAVSYCLWELSFNPATIKLKASSLKPFDRLADLKLPAKSSCIVDVPPYQQKSKGLLQGLELSFLRRAYLQKPNQCLCGSAGHNHYSGDFISFYLWQDSWN